MASLLHRAVIRRKEEKKKTETTAAKYNGLPITVGSHNEWQYDYDHSYFNVLNVHAVSLC